MKTFCAKHSNLAVRKPEFEFRLYSNEVVDHGQITQSKGTPHWFFTQLVRSSYLLGSTQMSLLQRDLPCAFLTITQPSYSLLPLLFISFAVCNSILKLVYVYLLNLIVCLLSHHQNRNVYFMQVSFLHLSLSVLNFQCSVWHRIASI